MEGISIPTPASQWSHNPKTGLSASSDLLDTCYTGREGWVVGCPTLPGGVGMKEIPSPKGFSREPWLPGSEEGGDSQPSNYPSELCHAIGNAPGSSMWGSAGAPSMSGAPHWRKLSSKIGSVRCGRKGPVAPTPVSAPSSLLYTLRKKRYTDTRGVLHFGARGGCLFRGRTNPHMGLIPSKTTGICPFTSDSNLFQPRKGYTPETTTRPLLPGVTTCNHIPWSGSWGGVVWIPVPGGNAGFPATSPVWALWTIWLSSLDPGAVSKCHALPATYEWLHCFLTSEEGWFTW